MRDIATVIQISPSVPDEEVIETCEELLENAKSGKLRGLLYLGLEQEKNISYGFIGAECKGQYMRLYGLTAYLQKLIMERWEGLSNIK